MALNQITPFDFENKVKNISQGVSGDQLIIEAQSYLRIIGFPIGNRGPQHNGVDGQFGEITQAGIEAFQILEGFEQIAKNITNILLIKLEQAVTAGSTIRSLSEIAYKNGVKLLIIHSSTLAEFVNAIYYYAIIDETNSKVPAAVTTAQAILETSYGKYIASDISSGQLSYNLFGIKGTGPAGSVTSWTREENPQTKIWEPIRARFRAYHDFLESIKDHSRFFYDNIHRYGAAFQTNNAADFARAIAKAGYATDSQYAVKIIYLMNYWGLT